MGLREELYLTPNWHDQVQGRFQPRQKGTQNLSKKKRRNQFSAFMHQTLSRAIYSVCSK